MSPGQVVVRCRLDATLQAWAGWVCSFRHVALEHSSRHGIGGGAGYFGAPSALRVSASSAIGRTSTQP
jgi:hypothetical protein